MVLSPEIMNELKQGNISKDIEKTKERVREVWAPLKRPKREEILSLAELKQPTVERTYKMGSLSIKLAIAIAQILKINPYYLTGESDDKQQYNEGLISRFIRSNGYKNIVVPEDDEDTDAVFPDNDDEDADEEQDEDGSFQEMFLEEPLLTLSILSENLFECMTDEERDQYDALSDDQVLALVQALVISAGLSPDKKNLFNLIKYMLVN